MTEGTFILLSIYTIIPLCAKTLIPHLKLNIITMYYISMI